MYCEMKFPLYQCLIVQDEEIIPLLCEIYVKPWQTKLAMEGMCVLRQYSLKLFLCPCVSEIGLFTATSTRRSETGWSCSGACNH